MRQLLAVFTILVLVFPVVAFPSSEARLQLLDEYHAFTANTQPITVSVPIWLQSQESGNRLDVEVFGVIDQPFSQVAAALSSPGSVCNFLLLNMNVKSCVHQESGRGTSLTIYVAGKSYAPPYRTITIEPIHQVARRSADYMAMTLKAKKGLMDSSDYQVLGQAVPYRGKTLLRLSSTYRGSRVTRLMTQTYLKTLGREKIGFTVVNRDKKGAPVYVRGLQGLIERGVVRSYFALQVQLENSGSEGFEQRIQRWYDLTEVHSRQLRDIDREEYLHNKRREYRNQLRLQAKLNRRIRQTADTRTPALGQGFNAVLTAEQ